MRLALCSLLAVLLFSATIFVPKARADEWNQRTRFTFTQPVEVPGKVLPAGTYWFQLLDSPSDREIVLIYNADQTRLCTTLLAASAWRYTPTSRTELTFAERRHDQPEAVMTWFYPGMQIGQEFLYPSREQRHLDRDAQQEILLQRSDSHNSTPTVIVRQGE
ncbi:MAG TPA: hypothetical protein VJQ82_21365 [Terriglobales bacterium]|nr:hypothetical protein [Terriglobales bacterium]